MIIKDELFEHIPLMWQLLHPIQYELAIEASIKRLAELAMKEDKDKNRYYWRRLIDDPQMELGL